MAQYTISLGDFIFINFDGDISKLFPEYTLYDPLHKADLQKKVVNHYLYYEVGQETPERFIHEFRTKWLELINLANKRYQAMDSDDLMKWYNYYYIKHSNMQKDGSGNAGKSHTVQGNDSTFLQTPYSNLSPSTDYATTKNKTDIDSTTEQTVDSETHSTDDLNETLMGWNNITPAEAIEKYLSRLIDVDNWIIEQLHECFMEVY